MFHDPTIVGSWPALAARLDDDAVLARWAEAEPHLAGVTTVAEMLAVWSEDGGSDRADAVLAALVRFAAVDGDRDDDALLLTLHLLSGLVWTIAAQLKDLSPPDIVAVVVGELACQIRRYPSRLRPRAVAANLRAETRRAVLAELRPRVRRHPDWGEFLTLDGDVTQLTSATATDQEDVDVVDLLQWAVRSGVDSADVALLIATECARDLRERSADQRVASAHGITTRTLYRRRFRALTALRNVAPQYLAAVA